MQITRATSQIVPIKPVELMEGRYDQHIGVYEDHLPKFLCDKLIKTIDDAIDTSTSGDYLGERAAERQQETGSPNDPDHEDTTIMQGVNQFPNTVLGRKDESILLQYVDAMLHAEINQYLQSCFGHYCKEYGSFNCKLISYDQKLQRTQPGGGYHMWHCENSTYEMANRTLVWMIYLNDVEEGGETEFLHQHVRFTPKRGTVVFWPAAFTHQHRGNPPLKGTKYILTGWYINCPTA